MMKQFDDDCAEIENSLPLFVGGDLESPAMGEVARHLAECPACSEREKAARTAHELLVSALVMSERKGPALWSGVRAGLVREGVLQPEAALVNAPAPRRPRLLPYAAAAAAVVAGFWLARGAFDGEGKPDPSNPSIAENRVNPAPVTPPSIPVGMNAGTSNEGVLRLVGKNERRLREGAEIYSELRLDVLGANDETWTTTPVNLRR